MRSSIDHLRPPSTFCSLACVPSSALRSATNSSSSTQHATNATTQMTQGFRFINCAPSTTPHVPFADPPLDRPLRVSSASPHRTVTQLTASHRRPRRSREGSQGQGTCTRRGGQGGCRRSRVEVECSLGRGEVEGWGWNASRYFSGRRAEGREAERLISWSCCPKQQPPCRARSEQSPTACPAKPVLYFYPLPPPCYSAPHLRPPAQHTPLMRKASTHPRTQPRPHPVLGSALSHHPPYRIVGVGTRRESRRGGVKEKGRDRSEGVEKDRQQLPRSHRAQERVDVPG